MVGWHSQEVRPAGVALGHWLVAWHALRGNIGEGVGDAKNLGWGEARTPTKPLTKPP